MYLLQPRILGPMSRKIDFWKTLKDFQQFVMISLEFP